MTGRPDYDVGDVVVTVTNERGFARIGSIARCVGIKLHPTDGWCAKVDRWQHLSSTDGWWLAISFRKIDAADEAFTRQMRAIKPAKVQA